MLIPKNLIKAAIPCAAKEDIRGYLKGALFDWDTEAKRLRVISTNGHVLSALSVEIPTCDDPTFRVVIPVKTLASVSKLKEPAQELKPFGDKWVLADQVFPSLEVTYGSFPDYRRVIPSHEGREESLGNYDADLLLSARACLRAYYDLPKQPTFPLSQNGPLNSAVMHNGQNDAVVVIMPVKVTNSAREPMPAYVGFI